jgi:hypothetical protein
VIQILELAEGFEIIIYSAKRGKGAKTEMDMSFK